MHLMETEAPPAMGSRLVEFRLSSEGNAESGIDPADGYAQTTCRSHGRNAVLSCSLGRFVTPTQTAYAAPGIGFGPWGELLLLGGLASQMSRLSHQLGLP